MTTSPRYWRRCWTPADGIGAEFLRGDDRRQPSLPSPATPANACVDRGGAWAGGWMRPTSCLSTPPPAGLPHLAWTMSGFCSRRRRATPEGTARPHSLREGRDRLNWAVSLVTLSYPLEAAVGGGASAAIGERRAAGDAREEVGSASDAGAPLSSTPIKHGELTLPLPKLAGAHQVENAGLAIAMLRHQDSPHSIARQALARRASAPHSGPRGCSASPLGPLTGGPGKCGWTEGTIPSAGAECAGSALCGRSGVHRHHRHDRGQGSCRVPCTSFAPPCAEHHRRSSARVRSGNRAERFGRGCASFAARTCRPPIEGSAARTACRC